MQLVKIRISHYKSIANPIEINLNNHKMYTFIGKNGCGKTNVLKALKYALDDSQYKPQEALKAEYVFKIEKGEREKYFPDFELQSKDDEYISITFDGTMPNIKRVQVPMFKVTVKEFKTRLEKMLNEYKQASKEYLEQLHLIESDYPYNNQYDFKLKDNYGGAYSIQKIQVENIERSIANQTQRIKEALSIFSEDKIELDSYGSQYSDLMSIYPPIWQIHELVESGIELPPMIAEYLNLSPEQIDEANEKIILRIREINNKLNINYQKVNKSLEQLKQIIEEINKVFSRCDDDYYKRQSQLYKRQNTFINKLRKTAFARCYYIDNEESLLFYANKENEYYRGINRESYLNSKNPILEAVDIFLKENKFYNDDESILNGKISQQRLGEVVKILNKEFLTQMLPEFEKDEDISCKFKTDDGRLELYVIEKDKRETNFNETCSGRRWYFTYKFVTKLLKKGDCLFIDEPAIFLHPNAQLEIKEELKQLAKSGVYVFITTHSPYMILERWDNVISLSNTKNGTEAKTFSSGDALCEEIVSTLGNFHTSDILFNLSKPLLFVEGEADKACIEKFAELLNYNLDDYHIHVCDGDSIVQLSYLCLKNDIKFKSIADKDNFSKADKYHKSHPNFRKCLEEMEKCNDKCIFIGDDVNGCLEDLFKEENDKFSHYEKDQRKNKISKEHIKGIKSVEELSDSTIRSFEKLFNKIGLKKRKA